MVRGFVGAILGIIFALILDFLEVDIYMIELLQPYLNFKLNIDHFYEFWGILGGIAGILPL